MFSERCLQHLIRHRGETAQTYNKFLQENGLSNTLVGLCVDSAWALTKTSQHS